MRRAVFSLALLVVMTLPAAAAAKLFNSQEHRFKVEVLTDRLQQPWGMAFLPSGEMLITEKPGRLRLLQGAKLSAPIKGLPKVRARGQGGLMDVVLDPDFAANKQIYLSYSEAGTGGAGTAVAKARFTGTALDNLTVIFRQNIKTGTGRHFGSRMVFARDGTLFFTIGDRGKRERAQDPFDHAGSVLRINKDGSIPENNPAVTSHSGLPEIWSIGHRNPQGIDIHPATGDVWTVSHGARGGDEVNRPQAGRNYGWPIISYGRHYSGWRIGIGTTKAGLEQPRYYWDPSIAPSSMSFYRGDLFPNWQGDMFVSALAGQHIARLKMRGEEIVAEERLLVRQYGRIRYVGNGPDGAVYVLTDNGKLLRLSPAG